MSTQGFMHIPGRRLPLITSLDTYDQLSEFSDKEKKVGKEMMYYQLKESAFGSHPNEAPPERLPERPPALVDAQLRNPYMVFQWDPELFKLEADFTSEMAKLVNGLSLQETMDQLDVNGAPIKDPDIRRRYDTTQFMVLKIEHDRRADWAVHVLASQPNLNRMLDNHQFALLGMPESAVWNDEQRLILQFCEGVMNRTVSDELFSRAEKFWGRKQMLRYAYWIGYYSGIACMVSSLNISDADRTGRL